MHSCTSNVQWALMVRTVYMELHNQNRQMIAMAFNVHTCTCYLLRNNKCFLYSVHQHLPIFIIQSLQITLKVGIFLCVVPLICNCSALLQGWISFSYKYWLFTSFFTPSLYQNSIFFFKKKRKENAQTMIIKFLITELNYMYSIILSSPHTMLI